MVPGAPAMDEAPVEPAPGSPLSIYKPTPSLSGCLRLMSPVQLTPAPVILERAAGTASGSEAAIAIRPIPALPSGIRLQILPFHGWTRRVLAAITKEALRIAGSQEFVCTGVLWCICWIWWEALPTIAPLESGG